MNKAAADFFSIPESELAGVTDLRGLEAPEPMEQILLACTRMGSNEHYLARLPHIPMPLFPHLQSRGLSWQVYEDTDGSTLIMIRRAS